jgi:hypothetical protein
MCEKAHYIWGMKSKNIEICTDLEVLDGVIADGEVISTESMIKGFKVNYEYRSSWPGTKYDGKVEFKNGFSLDFVLNTTTPNKITPNQVRQIFADVVKYVNNNT